MASRQISQWIEKRLGERPPRANSLIITVYGDMIAPRNVSVEKQAMQMRRAGKFDPPFLAQFAAKRGQRRLEHLLDRDGDVEPAPPRRGPPR